MRVAAGAARDGQPNATMAQASTAQAPAATKAPCQPHAVAMLAANTNDSAPEIPMLAA